jgi:anaerobic selenocysteine-containing dehydrogenase
LVAFPEPKWRDGLNPTDKPSENEFFVSHGKTPLMSFTSTVNNDLLLALNSIDEKFYWVWMHPNRAKSLGIKTGDKVKITETKTGKSVEARIYVTDLIREDTIFIPFGWVGKSDVLDYYKEFYDKYGPLPSYNELTPFQFDRVVTGFKTDEFTVTVEKV